MKVTDENSRDPDPKPDPLVRGGSADADTDPLMQIRIRTKISWIRNTPTDSTLVMTLSVSSLGLLQYNLIVNDRPEIFSRGNLKRYRTIFCCCQGPVRFFSIHELQKVYQTNAYKKFKKGEKLGESLKNATALRNERGRHCLEILLNT